MRYLAHFLLMVGLVLVALGSVNWIFVGVPNVTPAFCGVGFVIIMFSLVLVVVAKRRVVEHQKPSTNSSM